MSQTIDQIKKNKIKLESSIKNLLVQFEKDNDVFISYIDHMRKVSKKGKKRGPEHAIPEPERDGPIQDVNVNLRFDI